MITDLYDEYIDAKEHGEEHAYDCYAYVLSLNEPRKERDRSRLYVSDVGSCPRKVCYRILGAEKKSQTAQSRRNDNLMFELAGHIERVLVAALTWHGLGVQYQFPVDVFGRENWGGRGDVIADVDGVQTIIEVKTSRSSAFMHDKRDELGAPIPVTHLTPAGLPYSHHVYQTLIYQYCCEIDPRYDGLCKEPIIWQADRGGANTPRQWHLTTELQDAQRLHVIDMMDELEEWREVCDADLLPPKLPKVLKETSKKRGQDFNTKLQLVPDSRCGYCDYACQVDGSGCCMPEQGIETWGTRDNPGDWNFTAKAQGDVLEAYAYALLPA